MKTIINLFSTTAVSLSILLIAACGQTSMDAPSKSSSSSTSSVPAVEDLTASASLTEIELTWTNPTFSDPYYIRVQYKKPSDANFIIAATLRSDVESFKLTDLISDQAYDIRIQTITQDGASSSYSTTSAATHFPVSELKYPTFNDDKSVSFNGYNNTTTTWTWSETNFDNFDHVEVSRQILNNGTWTPISGGIKIDSSVTSYPDNPKASIVSYKFVIFYKDGLSANVVVGPATYSLPQITTITPSVVNISDRNDIQLVLNWSNSTHYQAVQSFEVQRKGSLESSYSTVTTVQTNGAALPASYTDDSITYANGAVTYKINVNYYNSDPDALSGDSASISIPASTVKLEYPDPVTSDSAIDAGNKIITLTWSYKKGSNYVDRFSYYIIVMKSDDSVFVSYPSDPKTTKDMYDPNVESYSEDFNATNSACGGAGTGGKIKIGVRAESSDLGNRTYSDYVYSTTYTCQ